MAKRYAGSGGERAADIKAERERCSRQLLEAGAEIERLREGLRMLVEQEYDLGYTPETYADAILSGHEPA